ncbi:VWA domain-containing protein [Waterburya agarophytonicola K14]|uniref:VWA domain-containing protein n=1 Tax=Waterburya agarophytonicola KI4 TaxID=2874699 RepID=A0A964C196_9CYAN|nr:VWA domain-containing protein [Waterburya agarophytonicola]MCC0179720.1 VWA domain-containing protein [Waterburya agarophytonicola KI4]
MKVNYFLSKSQIAVNKTTHVDVIINFQGEDSPENSRRPINLSLVLDRSGSMSGSPLRNALKAAEQLVEFLQPEDYLSVVVYDDVAETVIPPQLVTDKKAIKAAIKQIRARGITNLSAGWLMGCDKVQSQQTSQLLNRVLLLTDGLANMGIVEPSILVNTAKEKAEAGIMTTTLGFGSYFNEDLLIDLAEAGGGNFYFIQSGDDAANVFNIEMESLTSVVGQNLTVDLSTKNKTQVAEVLNKYPSQTQDSGVEVFLGDVYRVESKPLVLRFSIPAIATEGTVDLGVIEYSYEKVVDGSIKKFRDSFPLSIGVVSSEAASKVEINADVTQQASQLRIAQKKEEAVAIADKGNYQQAAEILRQAVAELKSQALNEYFEIAEEIEQLKYYAQRLDDRRFDLSIRKEMRDQSYQAQKRDREDLRLRGTSAGASNSLDIVTEAGDGIVLKCDRIKGKLRIRVVSEGYDPDFNVQFPRSIREEGASYLVDKVELSANGTFYRTVGDIRRLLKPGEKLATVTTRNTNFQKAKVKGTAADLPTTDTVGDGVLVQCLKEKSKLRARVVSDGYDPNWNMRFPRSIREEGMMYVVDEVKESSQGGFYLAYGEIKKFVQ